MRTLDDLFKVRSWGVTRVGATATATMLDEYRRQDARADALWLPCGHYTTGKAPFKFIDGYYMASFLRRHL